MLKCLRESCAGCGACASICAKQAISLIPDDEGFLVPRVDDSLCVRCGLCERVCPVLHPDETREPRSVFAARAHDAALRLASSSGGVFSLLSELTIANGGLVFGAALDADLVVRHRSAATSDELAALRGSKYVQSEIGDSFKQVRNALAEQRPVLFSGTPCQVAGLRRYLVTVGLYAKEGNPFLLLVETACMSIPSPLAFRRYLDDARARHGSDLVAVRFRDKRTGWKSYSMTLDFADGQSVSRPSGEDPFLCAFLSRLCSRRSCSNCMAKHLRSGADLTIADYWGVGTRFPEMDDDRGTSLVLVNTLNGESAFRGIVKNMELRQSDFAHASEVNPALVRSFPASERRSYFFKKLSSKPFELLVAKLTRPPLKDRLAIKIVKLLRALHLK